jgi:chromosome segregation ATPase
MSSFGPQDERNSQYGKEADLGYPDHRDDLRGPQVAGREQALKTQLSRLKTTVEHLQQLVQRQEIVINDYQIKYPSASIAPADADDETATAVGLAPWVADPLAMSPLLIAYDERMSELQSSNIILSEQVTKLKQSNDEFVGENQSLRADLKHYVERMLAYTEGSGARLTGSSTTSSMAHGEQMNELAEMNDVLNQTNTIMSEQIAMLEDHLNTTKKDLMETRSSLEEEQKNTQEMTAAMTQLSVMNRSLQMERDETVRRLQSATNDLSTMQSARDELAEVIRKHQSGNRLKEDQLNELKGALAEVAKAASEDQESLESRLTSMTEMCREFKAKLIAKESEFDATSEDLRNLRSEHATTRVDAEGMLKVMSTLESQLTEYAEREESTMSIAREAKEKVEQVSENSSVLVDVCDCC